MRHICTPNSPLEIAEKVERITEAEKLCEIESIIEGRPTSNDRRIKELESLFEQKQSVIDKLLPITLISIITWAATAAHLVFA